MAVLTTAEAKKFLQVPAGATDDDTFIDTLVTRADAICAGWCGYPVYSAHRQRTFTQQTYTLYLSGPGGRDLYAGVKPLVSVTTVEDDPNEDFDGSTFLVASTDYTLRKDEGRILLKLASTQGAWSSTDADVIKLVASMGFATIPEALKEAVGALVKHLWDLPERQGIAAQATGGQTQSYRPEAIPVHVKIMLTPFIVRSGFA